LYQAARIAKERIRALDFIDVRELVDEFARSIRKELDYRLEARHAQTIMRNFAGHPHVRIPRVYWSYPRPPVLTLGLLGRTPLTEPGVRYDRDREQEFVMQLRELYYRYYGARLAEIDPLQVIREAFALIYSMNLRLPSRFVLLDKAIATLGSVGVELYEDFNVFEVAKPYARNLMLGRYTPQRMLRRARKEALQLAEIAYEMPYQI